MSGALTTNTQKGTRGDVGEQWMYLYLVVEMVSWAHAYVKLIFHSTS